MSIHTNCVCKVTKNFLHKQENDEKICICQKKVVTLHGFCRKMTEMKRFLGILMGILLCTMLCEAQQIQAYLDYIETYREAAQAQEQKYKVPAYITLAQGLLESGAGTSMLAREANNHFGVKCHNDWAGETFYQDDDEKNECFRKYSDPSESFEDHSRFLLRTRYASLFELPISDYQGWARGLKACGYATDPAYADKLIRIIEEYHLADDSLATACRPLGDTLTTVGGSESNLRETRGRHAGDDEEESEISSPSIKRGQTMGSVDLYATHYVFRRGVVKWVEAELGDTYASIADEFTMSESTLRRFNNARNRQEPEAGQVVYLTRH